MVLNGIKKFQEELARDAGRITLRYFRKPLRTEEKAEYKGIVSEADIQTEKFIVKSIKSKFPEHRILAEESAPNLAEKDGYLWIIDPIDGTTNFVQGNVYYCISIALYFVEKGRAEPIIGCVHQPASGDLYIAENKGGAYLNGKSIQISQIRDAAKGSYGTGFAYNSDQNLQRILKSIGHVRSIHPTTTVRVNGAAALDMCRTAEGILDGFWEFNLSPWDMAAGSMIIREAGGVVTNFSGAEFDPLRDKNVICGSPITHRLLAEVIGPIFT